METRSGPAPDDDTFPGGTLEDIQQVRRRLAPRMTAPWWYHLGAALCTASIFLGIGLFLRADRGSGGGESLGTVLLILGAIFGPTLLLAALKQRTGIAVDRYARGMGAWYAVVFGVFTVAMIVQIATGQTLLLFAGAPIAFVATLLLERRIDALLTRRAAHGPQHPAAA